ncbi:mechanosensitive ion channel [Candidatus Woesearchaeota archaeon]|nr:mechanosensitive ion channel [Candidatus Woesearchaeota archaeon]
MAYEGILGIALMLVSTVVNRIVVAAVVLLVGLIAARLLGKLVERILREIELNRIIYNVSKVSIPADEVVGSLAKYAIYFFSILTALEILSLQAVILNTVAIIISVIIVLSVILSLKDFISNVGAGIFIHQRGAVHKGDLISVDELEGSVLGIDLVDTRIETRAHDIIFVPNSYLIRKVMVVKKRRSAQ